MSAKRRDEKNWFLFRHKKKWFFVLIKKKKKKKEFVPHSVLYTKNVFKKHISFRTRCFQTLSAIGGNSLGFSIIRISAQILTHFFFNFVVKDSYLRTIKFAVIL